MQGRSNSLPDALEDVVNKLATHTANDSMQKHHPD